MFAKKLIQNQPWFVRIGCNGWKGCEYGAHTWLRGKEARKPPGEVRILSHPQNSASEDPAST
jgi:hypothetical protein